jgi:hypothetical protein
MTSPGASGSGEGPHTADDAFACERPDHRCPFPTAECFKRWRCLNYSSENERKVWSGACLCTLINGSLVWNSFCPVHPR